MAKISSELLAKLQSRLGISQSRAYRLIEQKALETHLPRHQAAMALAASRGINYQKYATDEDRAAIREAARAPSAAPAAGGGAVQAVRATIKRAVKSKKAKRTKANTVFVVHGRDKPAHSDIQALLRALGLQPIEWTQALRMSRKAAPYVGEVLDAVFEQAAAVVVLLTPDDEARLRKNFLEPKDGPHERELTGQARANVLFEAGMAFGSHPDSTVIVQLGEVRPFSDVGGRHVVHLDGSAESRNELVAKLRNAGCGVDVSGSSWLSMGNFRR